MIKCKHVFKKSGKIIVLKNKPYLKCEKCLELIEIKINKD